MNWLAGRLRSFVPALRGLRELVVAEPNARVHAVASVLVVGAGLVLGLDAGDWLAVALATGLVWSAEALNTAIELLADEISPQLSGKVRVLKDIAAFGVLAAATVAAAVGLIVFTPYLAG